MRQSIQRRSFLKYCLAGGAGLLAGPGAWTGSLRAQTAVSVAAGWRTKFPQGKTLCGVLAPFSLQMMKTLGAQAGRITHFPCMSDTMDADIAAAKQGKFLEHFQLVKDLGTAGYPIIITTGWGEAKGEGGGGKGRKVKLPAPGSSETQKMYNTARNLVEVLGPYLAGVMLENEPFDTYEPSELSDSAWKWFGGLAAVIRQAGPHLLISTPAMMINTLSHGKSKKQVDAFYEWAQNDPNIDSTDVHCHVSDAEEIEKVLSIVSKKFSRGITVTEWSQAARLFSWETKRLDAAFAAKWKRAASLTNGNYVMQCEHGTGPGQGPVSLEEWNDFMATTPLDPDFMSKAFDIIKKHGVLAACYGAAQQNGSSRWDMKMLYANLAVKPGPDGKAQPNYKLVDWYKALAAANPLT